ncbi:hypothetical protein GW915_12380 [bacterium]|nr:hypothetical protein [bacterium]
MKKLPIFLFLLFSISAWSMPNRPVQWGGDPEFDACGGFGYVMGTTVMITTTSNGRTEIKRVIPAGTKVTFCDSDDDFHGVLIHQEGVDCGGGNANVPVRRSYDGPCESGWIMNNFLLMTAG